MGADPPPRVVVPRLFNLAGPFLNKPDSYVLGSILEDIETGRTDSTSCRPTRWCAPTSTSATWSIWPLPSCWELDRCRLEAFDTAGEREIEVGELAELAATVLGRPGMPVLRPPVDDTQVDRYVGDPAVINSLARSYGITLTPLPRQIEDTARYLKV